MNGNNISKINTVWDAEEAKTIEEIALELAKMLVALGAVDPIFRQTVWQTKNQKDLPINLEHFTKEALVDYLTQHMLTRYEGDILKNDGLQNPALGFKRDMGFSFVFNYTQKGESVFSYIPRLGAKGRNAHALGFFQAAFNFEYTWGLKVLKQLIQESQTTPKYGCIGLSNVAYTKKIKRELRIEWPIELATYFSAEIAPHLQDLSLHTEKSSRGGLLVYPFSAEDFISDNPTATLTKELLHWNKQLVRQL